LRASSEIFN